MKTIILFLFCCLFPFLVKGDITLYTGDYTILPGDNIEIPIKANGLDGFISLQLFLDWDKDILSYVSLDNLSPSLPGLNTNDFGTANVTTGTFSMVWQEAQLSCVGGIPDGTTIFTLTFHGVGAIGDISSLSFSKMEAIDCSYITPIAVSGTVGSVTLPVDLKQFTVRAATGANLLEWEVDQEENMDGYEIQRSVDGINFETIAWQEAEVDKHHYAYHDRSLNCTDTYYYRLKMLELNGSFEFSAIVVQKQLHSSQAQGLKVNNPFTNTLEIATCGPLDSDIELYNLSGQKILQVSGNSASEQTIATSHLASGVYIARIGKQTVKLIKH